MWETGLFKTTVVSKLHLDKAPNPRKRVIFATLPREIRDKVYKCMLTDSDVSGGVAMGRFIEGHGVLEHRATGD